LTRLQVKQRRFVDDLADKVGQVVVTDELEPRAPNIRLDLDEKISFELVRARVCLSRAALAFADGAGRAARAQLLFGELVFTFGPFGSEAGRRFGADSLAEAFVLGGGD
jgi:hypothetical protein